MFESDKPIKWVNFKWQSQSKCSEDFWLEHKTNTTFRIGIQFLIRCYTHIDLIWNMCIFFSNTFILDQRSNEIYRVQRFSSVKLTILLRKKSRPKLKKIILSAQEIIFNMHYAYYSLAGKQMFVFLSKVHFSSLSTLHLMRTFGGKLSKRFTCWHIDNAVHYILCKCLCIQSLSALTPSHFPSTHFPLGTDQSYRPFHNDFNMIYYLQTKQSLP